MVPVIFILQGIFRTLPTSTPARERPTLQQMVSRIFLSRNTVRGALISGPLLLGVRDQMLDMELFRTTLPEFLLQEVFSVRRILIPTQQQQTLLLMALRIFFWQNTLLVLLLAVPGRSLDQQVCAQELRAPRA